MSGLESYYTFIRTKTAYIKTGSKKKKKKKQSTMELANTDQKRKIQNISLISYRLL